MLSARHIAIQVWHGQPVVSPSAVLRGGQARPNRNVVSTRCCKEDLTSPADLSAPILPSEELLLSSARLKSSAVSNDGLQWQEPSSQYTSQQDIAATAASNFDLISQLCALLALLCVACALIPTIMSNAKLLAAGNTAAVAQDSWQVGYIKANT